MLGFKSDTILDLFSFKDSDWVFFTIKLLTFIFCLPWPLTLIASIMTLAGHIPQNTPYYQVILGRLFGLALLVYPITFFLIIKLAEKMIAPKIYLLGVLLGSVPILTSMWVLYTMFFKLRN